METYSIDLESPFDLKTYEGVKKTFGWITEALKAFGKKPIKTTESFLFHLGKITCSVDSFSDFKKQAFGAEGFELINFQVIAFYAMEKIIHFNCSNTVYISASKKEWLEAIIALLNPKNDAKDNTPAVSITYNDSIVVNGDKNIVASDNSTVSLSGEHENEKKTSKLKTWIVAIGQNLVANGIWYLLCLVVGAVITLLATK